MNQEPLGPATVPTSPYLVQALQGMSQPPPKPQQMPVPSADQLSKFFKDRDAWTTANPGQSYVGHNLAEAGRNLMAAPGNALAGLQNGVQALTSIPGQLSGLFSLGRAASGQ